MSNSERMAQLAIQVEAGSYLLELRREKDLSLAKVTKLTDISSNYLSEIERGLKAPSDTVIRELAKVYEADENEIFEKYHKIPLSVKEALNNSQVLRRTLAEIEQNKKLTEEQKIEIYTELYRLYKKYVDE